MGGTFDVRISKKFYWMNQVSPVVKGCPTELCDLDAGPDDNGCGELSFLFFVSCGFWKLGGLNWGRSDMDVKRRS